MEGIRERPSFYADNGCNTPICEEDLDDEEPLPYHKFSHEKQQASTFSLTLPRYFKLIAVLLVLLAAILLMVNIGLGVKYRSLTDTHLSLDETKRISSEITTLKETMKDNYHNTFETLNKAKEKQDTAMKLQKQTQWEFEHQTERGEGYQMQADKIKKEIAKLRPHLLLIGAGCKYCPAGWILLNSMCFYFPLSESSGVKSWQKSREYCQLYGGDLAVIDSKDQENATIAYLRNQHGTQTSNGYWFGLKAAQNDRIWKWVDGSVLVEGFWDTGEPSGDNNNYCGSLYPKENFFKAWQDNPCGANRKWICGKTPATIL